MTFNRTIEQARNSPEPEEEDVSKRHGQPRSTGTGDSLIDALHRAVQDYTGSTCGGTHLMGYGECQVLAVSIRDTWDAALSEARQQGAREAARYREALERIRDHEPHEPLDGADECAARWAYKALIEAEMEPSGG